MGKKPPTKTKEGKGERELPDDDGEEFEDEEFEDEEFEDEDDEDDDIDEGESWKRKGRGPRKKLVDIEVKGGYLNTVTLSMEVGLQMDDEGASRAELRRLITILQDAIPRAEMRGYDEEHLENIPMTGWDHAANAVVPIPQKAREAWAMQRKLLEEEKKKNEPERQDGPSSP